MKSLNKLITDNQTRRYISIFLLSSTIYAAMQLNINLLVVLIHSYQVTGVLIICSIIDLIYIICNNLSAVG